MKLPELFKNRMKELLGEEYGDYEAGLCTPPFRGIRVNTLKITPKEWEALAPFPFGERVPWTENGWLVSGEVRPAAHPLYAAGLYYLQEPSAMAPAALLPVHPGDRVLDLCAAPGGKATELGAALCNKGLLVANDISSSRAGGLLKNIELFGIPNALVVSEAPERLASYFPCFFDKILVDAPCSGEGMFRRDEHAAAAWLQKGPAYYSGVQRQILKAAVALLKPGGLLLYSTCTFSPEEDEQTVSWLLKNYPEMDPLPIEKTGGMEDGRPEWADGDVRTKACARFWPHRTVGEGHFAALLRKGESDEKPGHTGKPSRGISREAVRALEAFYDKLGMQWSVPSGARLLEKNRKLYLLPEAMPSFDGLRVLRSGLLMGELKNTRFEPGQALAMAARPESFPSVNLKLSDPLVMKYLKGESVEWESREEGFRLICLEHWALGWAKLHHERLKNKYSPGWRRM